MDTLPSPGGDGDRGYLQTEGAGENEAFDGFGEAEEGEEGGG
jgi:hypothetical protein